MMKRTMEVFFRSAVIGLCSCTLFVGAGCITKPETVDLSSVAGTVTIADTPKRTSNNAQDRTAAPVIDTTPYRMSKGQRDPFVPFGGMAAPASTLTQRDQAAAKAAAAKESADNDAKNEDGTAKTEITVVGDNKQPTKKEVVTIPIKVTGTMTVGGTRYALLTPDVASSGNSSSATVTARAGERVGEYLVDYIGNDSVVLIWKGKAYTLPISKDLPAASKSSPSSSSSSAPSAGDSNTLPAPEVKTEEAK